MMKSTSGISAAAKQRVRKMLEEQGILMIQNGHWEQYFKMLNDLCKHNIVL